MRDFTGRGKLVTVICKGQEVLAHYGYFRKDLRVASSTFLKSQYEEFGCLTDGTPAVRDGNIITSRLPSDLPVFGKEIVNYLKEAPRRRNSDKMLTPSNGRAPVSPIYTHVAELSQGPRGTASADYTTIVKIGERVA